MNNWYQNKVYVGVGLLALLIMGWFIFFNGDKGGVTDVSSTLEKIENGNVRIAGVIECLPYRNEEESEGCVKGIKDAEGRFFAIDSAPVKFAENAMPTGTDVVAVGTYYAADMSNDESGPFLYDGVIVLESLTKQ